MARAITPGRPLPGTAKRGRLPEADDDARETTVSLHVTIHYRQREYLIKTGMNASELLRRVIDSIIPGDSPYAPKTPRSAR